MDSGEVIPGLNEEWTFCNCKVLEWMSGFMVALLVATTFAQPAKAMPLLLVIAVGTTLTLSVLRRRFPDEERGVRNLCMVKCGFAPPGIPTPSKLQPFWSGGRIGKVRDECLYSQLGLEALHDRPSRDPRRPGRL